VDERGEAISVIHAEVGIDMLGRGGDGGTTIQVNREISDIATFAFDPSRGLLPECSCACLSGLETCRGKGRSTLIRTSKPEHLMARVNEFRNNRRAEKTP